MKGKKPIERENIHRPSLSIVPVGAYQPKPALWRYLYRLPRILRGTTSIALPTLVNRLGIGFLCWNSIPKKDKGST